MKKSLTLEICVDSVQSAMAAEKGGAQRVELCDNLLEGGTTPSVGMIELARKNISIGLHILLRPRRGDFLYSALEFEIMKKDIAVAKELGADGLVVGILTADGNVDMKRMFDLVELCKPLPVTFHRAFDLTADPFQALDDILQLKISRLLTSGQKATAFEGLDLISKLIKKAGDRLVIMPGGGINEQNIRNIVTESGACECHTSARSKVFSQMEFRRENLAMGAKLELSEYEYMAADADRIMAIRAAAEI
jgi:copper homeostasis protein